MCGNQIYRRQFSLWLSGVMLCVCFYLFWIGQYVGDLLFVWTFFGLENRFSCRRNRFAKYVGFKYEQYARCRKRYDYGQKHIGCENGLRKSQTIPFLVDFNSSNFL